MTVTDIKAEGLRPLLERPKVTINGVEREMRGLGWKDGMTILEICRDVYIRGTFDLQVRGQKWDWSNPNDLAGIVALGVAAGGDKAMRWVGSLVGLDYDAVCDPEQFPLGTEVDIVGALSEHPGMHSFFASLDRQKDRLKWLGNHLKTLMPGDGGSTSSNPSMDGQTTKS